MSNTNLLICVSQCWPGHTDDEPGNLNQQLSNQVVKVVSLVETTTGMPLAMDSMATSPKVSRSLDGMMTARALRRCVPMVFATWAECEARNEELRALLEEGKPLEAIQALYAQRYGSHALAVTPNEGWSRARWAVPRPSPPPPNVSPPCWCRRASSRAPSRSWAR